MTNVVDQLLRRYGIVLLILALPGLIVPAVAMAQSSVGPPSFAQSLVIGLGYGASFAGYVALAYFTVRAFRRRASVRTKPAPASVAIEAPRRRSRAGITMVIAGGSLVVLSVLGGLVSFFIPFPVEDPIASALRIFLPGLLGISGFAVAIVGGVLVAVASATRPD